MARILRPFEVYPITTRMLEVLRVEDVTPGMRRVVLGGEGLKAHSAENGMPVNAFRSDGVDDEFKICFKHPDAEEIVGPTQSDGLVIWPRGDEHLVFRTYTARRWDREAGELTVDFVIHGVGPATTWAMTTTPGERIQVVGPKMSSQHPAEVDWTLIAGDETALPAIARWLEEWPAGARAQVFIEVAEASHKQELPVPEGVELTWLVRSDVPEDTNQLLDALQAAPWWEGRAFAWVAGEAGVLTPIRRWLRNEKGLAKDEIEITGYWKKQVVTEVEGEDAILDEMALHDTFHEVSEIASGFAVRVAVTIGLGEAFASGTRSVTELAAATATDARALGRLLRYLSMVGIVELATPAASITDARYRLTVLGQQLESEHAVEELSFEGPEGWRELRAMLSLLEVVRTGKSEAERDEVSAGDWFDVPYETRMRHDPSLVQDRFEDAESDAEYVAGALASSPVFGSVRSLAMAGTGVSAISRELLSRYDGLNIQILATPSELELLRKIGADRERVTLTPGDLLVSAPQGTDAVLMSEQFTSMPDADIVHQLRLAGDAVGESGRVLAFCDVLIDARNSDADYANDLIEMSLTGGGERTDQEHHALFAAAGLRVVSAGHCGLGICAV